MLISWLIIGYVCVPLAPFAHSGKNTLAHPCDLIFGYSAMIDKGVYFLFALAIRRNGK